MNFLDLIFPKYCVNCKRYGDFLCDECFSKLSFESDEVYEVAGIKVFVGLRSNFLSRKLIRKFKDRPNLNSLSSFISDLLYESLIQQEEFNKILKNKNIIIPLPISKRLKRYKGYNPNELLARDLGRRFKFNFIDLLKIEEKRITLNRGIDLNNMNILIVMTSIFDNKLEIERISNFLKNSGVNRINGISFIRE